MWTIFEVFIEFITILLHFMSWFFGYKACGILTPQPGIKPIPAALESEILTTGLPGKSPASFLITGRNGEWTEVVNKVKQKRRNSVKIKKV